MGKGTAAAARQNCALHPASAAGCRSFMDTLLRLETNPAMGRALQRRRVAAVTLGGHGYGRLRGGRLDPAATHANARHDNESMKALRRLATVLVVVMWATAAHGDGGAMLLHQDAGAFTVTLFAAPQPLQVGTADFSVLVQDR